MRELGSLAFKSCGKTLYGGKCSGTTCQAEMLFHALALPNTTLTSLPQVLKEKLREALEANKAMQAELAARRQQGASKAAVAGTGGAAAAPLGVENANKENAC